MQTLVKGMTGSVEFWLGRYLYLTNKNSTFIWLLPLLNRRIFRKIRDGCLELLSWTNLQVTKLQSLQALHIERMSLINALGTGKFERSKIAQKNIESIELRSRRNPSGDGSGTPKAEIMHTSGPTVSRKCKDTRRRVHEFLYTFSHVFR